MQPMKGKGVGPTGGAEKWRARRPLIGVKIPAPETIGVAPITRPDPINGF